MARIATALLLATLTAASGCNDSEGEVRQVVRDYNAAVANGDGKRACALLTRRGREIVLAFSIEQSLRDRTSGCVSTVAVLGRFEEGREIKELGSAKVTAAQIHDATARVNLQTADGTASAMLKRQDNGWRIDFPPGFD
jgi:hypothetical protein